jgi:hypothetical protein
LYFLHISGDLKENEKLKRCTVLGGEPAQCCGLKTRAAHGHTAVAHLAKPANAPDAHGRVVTRTTADTVAQVPPVD